MSDLYDGIDYNNLNFEYVGPTKSVSFCKYMNSKQIFNAIKNNQIRINEAKEKQKDFLKKLNDVKMGKKSAEQKKVIDNLNKLYLSREDVINFFRYYFEILSEASYRAKQDGAGLKILTTPKQMLQRLRIALAQVTADNNSESLLNEIRQIVYSLYQSKQITKKVYNNIIKSIQ